ncbi:MAG: asparagine synthase (glutamine-hydrolyzing) [Nonlabens sp.]
MCGIAGIWNRNGQKVEQSHIQRFTDSIAHRGSDSSGYYIDPSKTLALGHRRLTILDKTDAGKQPMSIDQNLWISYNGEVFNFLELRKELQSLGFTFYSDTDTEVILAAYKAWGMDCFSRFNGMWAIAIYDNTKQELILIRDRYAIKPLFYSIQNNGNLAFASETIAFKNLEGFQRSFDHDNLQTVIADSKALEGYGKTVFENIKQVKPGHFLRITNDQVIESRWWYPREQKTEVPKTYEDQVDRLTELIDDACALRMRSDVPIASALSGGLDSSSVYATLHKINSQKNVDRLPKKWQNAYTLVFPGSPQDELIYAQKVAKHVGQKIIPVHVDYADVDSIIQQTKLFDSVYDNPNFIAVSLYKAMRNDGIKVSLDGHGVDELLFGYPDMIQKALKLKEFSDDDTQQELNALIAEMVSRPDFKKPEKKEISITPVRSKGYFEKKLKSLARRIYRKIQPAKNTQKPSAKPKLPQLPQPSLKKITSHEDITDLYFYESILPSILRNFDRASMQAGVEVRMPFMDYRVVDYLHALPFESKVKFPYAKRIVRDAMKDTLPDSIRFRTSKVGLVAPMDDLFNRYMKDFTMDIVSSQKFLNSGFWDGTAVKAYADYKSKTNSWSMHDGMQVWPYLNAYLIQD